MQKSVSISGSVKELLSQLKKKALGKIATTLGQFG